MTSNIRPRSLMDRTRVCGIRNEGSIPSEDTE